MPDRKALAFAICTMSAAGLLVGACVGDDAATSSQNVPLDAADAAPTPGTDAQTGGDASIPDTGGDVAVDAGPCDLTKTFGTPKLVPSVNTTSNENALRMSHDGLTAYIDSDRPGGEGGADIWVTTRGTLTQDFAAPTKLLGPVNTNGYEGFPSVTPDHKTMYFTSDTGGGPLRLYVTSRNTTAVAFGATSEVPGGGADKDAEPWVTASGIVYMATTRNVVKYELWRYSPNGGGDFTATSIGELNMAGRDARSPTLTEDELTIYWGADRDVAGELDIWKATRDTTGEAFGKITKVSELSTSSLEYPVYVEPNGCTLYFSAFRGTSGVGQRDIWYATKPK